MAVPMPASAVTTSRNPASRTLVSLPWPRMKSTLCRAGPFDREGRDRGNEGHEVEAACNDAVFVMGLIGIRLPAVVCTSAAISVPLRSGAFEPFVIWLDHAPGL